MSGDRLRLPGFGRVLIEARRRGEVPATRLFWLVIRDWHDMDETRWRAVVPAELDPTTLDLCFVAGLDVYVTHYAIDTALAERVARRAADFGANSVTLFDRDYESSRVIKRVPPIEVAA